MRGRFITFEGGEGSGKSTQARLLAEYLRQAKVHVVETREPGGSPFAERLREFLLDPSIPQHSSLSEALLFNAARHDHLETIIRPALSASKWVVCDRFMDSTRVYQGSAGKADIATLRSLEEIVVGPTKPDLTVLLDIDPVEGLSRALRRAAGTSSSPPSPDAFEGRDLAFHYKLWAGFQSLAAMEPSRFLVLDATQPIEILAMIVRGTVLERFGPI